MKRKNILLFSFTSMAIAIILGAFGAHYLKEQLHLPMEKLNSWQTGIFYQIVHSLAILLLFILEDKVQLKTKVSIRLFILGIILFSGSIYGLTLNNVWEIKVLKYILVPLTPLGGISFILGWVLLTFNLLKK